MAEDTAHAEQGNGEDRNQGTEENKSLLNRRDALKMGAAAAAAGLSGVGAMAGSAAAATERYGISFDRVVNAVDDLGLDPNGNEPIDAAINRTIDRGDTLIEFPPGTYYWKNTVAESGVNNWGIRGLGEHPSDVKFVSDKGASQFLLKVNGGRGILVENFTIDYGFDRQGSLGMLLKAHDDLRVQDIHYVGFNPTQGNGAVDNLSPQAIDRNGTVIVDGLVRTGPTDITSHGHLGGDANEGCIWLGSKHVGELIIRNSHIENTGTNAIYARAAHGDVKVEDSLFVNNNQTSLRIGGDGSHVKGCRFVVDTDNATDENGGEFINPHSITWETGKRGEAGGVIEDCDFIYKSAPSKTTAAVWVDGSAGELAIRNSRFQMDADGIAAIRIDDPRDPRLGVTPDRPWGVTLDGVSVTGSSSGSAPAIRIDNRNGSVIRNSCLQLTGNRDGIYLRNSNNSSIENTNINVKGQATIFNNSDVSTSGITNSDSCPVPDDTFTVGDGETTRPSTGSYSAHPNSLTVTGNGTRTNYEFSASGGVDKGNESESWDSVESGNVSAWITEEGDTDTYGFSGGLGPVSFVEGEATITVNGVDVDPATLVADAECDHTLQIVPNGTSTNYHLEVSGGVMEHPGLGTSLTKYDTIDGGVLDGWTTNDIDAVQFSGDVTAFSFTEGEATLYLDGEEVAPSEIVSETSDGSTSDGSTDGSTDDSTSDGSTDDSTSDGSTDGSTDDSSTDSGSTDSGSSDGSTDSGSTDGSTDDGSTDGSTDSGSSDGSTDGSTDGTQEHTLEIVPDGTSTNYRLEVTGEIEDHPDLGTSLSKYDSLDGNVLEGWVTNVADGVRFTGDVTDFTFVEGEATLLLDGAEVTPSELVSGTSDDSTSDGSTDDSTDGGSSDGSTDDSTDDAYDHTLEIVPDGTSTNYRLEVTGEIADHPDLGTSLSKYDSLDGNVLEGWATNDADGVQFNGRVTDFTFVEGEATVYLDGTEVEPSELVFQTLPNVITLDGSKAEHVTGYEITVTGELERDAENSVKVSSWDNLKDRVNGSTVVGVVDDGIDRYRFSGDIETMDVNGKASVSFEDNDN